MSTVNPPTDTGTKVVLYHGDWGRSCRAIFLLRQLEVPFTLKVIEWMQIKDQKFMESVSPLGRIPVLYDGETHLYESGAMVEYLLHKYGPGKLMVPVGGRQHADYLQWFHAAEDSMLLPAVAKVYRCKRFPASRTPERLEEGTQAVQRVLQVLEDHLRGHHKGEWLAGPDFTAADIMLSYTLELLKFASQSPAEVPAVLTADRYPEAAAYWDRLQALPGYKDCYEDINLLPVGEHLIKPGDSFRDVAKCQPTIFWDFKF